jgi:mRNA interferase MazF
LKRITVAAITRQARGIPTEVALDEDDGMPTKCAVTLDNIGDAWKRMLVDQVTTLTPERMSEVCQALSIALEC